MKTAAEQIKQEELETFKQKSRESALNSFSNAVSFFVFSEWVKEHYEDQNDRKKVIQGVFNQWFNQMNVATSPVFKSLNETLNDPKVRWGGLIDSVQLSTEDYNNAFITAIKEIRDQFYKICGENE